MSSGDAPDFHARSFRQVLLAVTGIAICSVFACLAILLTHHSSPAAAVAGDPSGDPPSFIYAATSGGQAVLPLFFDRESNVMWGTVAPVSNLLYKSSDFGLTWTLVYSFPRRNQLLGGPNLYDKVYAVQVLDTGTVLVSVVNQANYYNGTIYRSTDGGATFTRARYANGIGFGDNAPFEYIRGVSLPWAFDHNADYALAGTYSFKDPAGLTDRDVWMSTDDGRTWNRAMHVEGNGSVNALNIHSHMARIDPDGGAWISFGDHDPGWNYTNQTYGLWYSPRTPTPISGEPAGDNYGSFTRIYHHAASNNWARIRPVTVIFKRLPTGEKYAYLGEDDMGEWEGRTITRLRYDDGSFSTHVVANLTASAGTSPAFNGPIFGMTQITPDYWVAAAAEIAGTVPASSWTLLYSTDGGESWQRDPGDTVPVQNLLPYTVNGRVWGGRPPYDTQGPGYRPPTRVSFTASPANGQEPLSVDFSDGSMSPLEITEWHWDFGDGETGDSATPTHTFLEDGSYSVTLRVTDEDGWTSTGNLIINVEDAPPSLSEPQLNPAPEGQATQVACDFEDPGALDTHAATIDWGDGTVEAVELSESSGAGSLSGGHVYRRAGTYTLSISVTDDDGATSNKQATVSVGCGLVEPGLGSRNVSAYWQTYDDYLQRILTVQYVISNRSDAYVNDVSIVGSVSTNGVAIATSLPLSVATSLGNGQDLAYELRYLVPGNVNSFRTITFATATNGCLDTFTYPGPYAQT